MSYPNDANGDVLRRLEDNGFDFSASHDVEFFALFPTEEAADTVARLYAEDHRAGDIFRNIETKPAENGGMELILVKSMIVTYDNVSTFEARLGDRASRIGGSLVGWGLVQES